MTKKSKLTPRRQIAFLRGKGMTFERASEVKTMRYISRESYLFAACAYRALFFAK
ncbi:hypothetical protein [Olsenella sp. HMSC062G07]|uniref:hypothetical protein n=1 Tax=Olsenella sp. HMSC062G07 TaxID=1739330 RepID=UPI001439ECF0|nr:hypothetical protein [Olsenella sp. HMSC062G07]